MSARKQRRVGDAQDSTNPESIKSADGDGSDSESSGGTGRGTRSLYVRQGRSVAYAKSKRNQCMHIVVLNHRKNYTNFVRKNLILCLYMHIFS